MLVQSQQLTAVARAQSALKQDAETGPFPREELMLLELHGNASRLKLFNGFAKGQRIRLSEEVGHQLVVTADHFSRVVHVDLRLRVSDKLGRNNTTLMHQLIEGMLAIRARLSKDNRPGWDGKRHSSDSHTLAVAFHVKLLNVRWETQEGLAVREDGARFITTNVGVVESN